MGTRGRGRPRLQHPVLRRLVLERPRRRDRRNGRRHLPRAAGLEWLAERLARRLAGQPAQPSRAGWNFSERAEEDTGPAKDRATAPEPVADTGSTSTPTSPAKGRGKRGGPSALRQNQPLERAYRQHAAQRWADDLPRVSRSSFNRNRSRPPRAVRQAAKAKAAGPSSSEQPTPGAVSPSGAQSSTDVPRPAGVNRFCSSRGRAGGL